jgi:hypothetical protein
LGAGLLLQQTGTLEPTSLLGLAFPALGLIVGAMVGGAMGRGRGRMRA